jgi:hypothetical protein
MGKNPMIKLIRAVEAWQTPDFESTLKNEIQNIDAGLLPLQQGLSHTSYVCDAAISVVILNITETSNSIRAKTGVFYAGVIAGSCCADDPTPVNEQTEYCELQFDINKTTAEATVTILND